MKDNIFAELYNKILGFFRQTEETSKDVACNRLRVVLMQDRTNLTPQLLEKMRSELVELLSKYLEMDKDALELNLDQEGEQMALMLSIPVIRAKDEAEIAAEEESEESEESKESEEAEETEQDKENETLDDQESENTETPENETKTTDKQPKFPNKEICGDCRECELSDDIECEKKKLKDTKQKTEI